MAFKLDASGTETPLHAFKGGTDGDFPDQGVIIDSAGRLYGTTYAGGISNAGVVFKLTNAGRESILYTFTGGADGLQPFSGLVRDGSGNLYGTTFHGGITTGPCGSGCGVVYKVTP